MKKAGPIIGIVIALIVAGIAFLNQTAVTLNLWVTQVSVPLWALLAGTFLLGLLTGILFMLPSLQKRGGRARDLEDELDKTKRERDSIAEETRRESEADLAQKNSEINGLNARIESLEQEVRERIRNSQAQAAPAQPVVTDTTTADYTTDLDEGSQTPMPSRKERRMNKQRTNGDQADYPESPENNSNRDDVASPASAPHRDHKTFDRRDEAPDEGDTHSSRDSDHDHYDHSADADLVVKEVDDKDRK